MRKIILLISIGLFAFTDNSIKLKKDKVEETKTIITNLYQYIDKSNLPHQEVLQIETSLKTAYNNLSDSTK